MLKQKLVSIIIPTKNSSEFLENCLRSVRNQNYKNIEVIIVDGGSNDATLKIARKYGAKILNNKLVLAEPGVDFGCLMAKGEFCVILAADNIIDDEKWLEKMIKPFENVNVMVTYPIQTAEHKNDFWINIYMNTFTDPFNHFVYGDASNTRTYGKIFNIKKKTEDYILYQFFVKNHPVLALAQGTTIRSSYKRQKNHKYDDFLPIIDIIQKGYDLAYVPDAKLIHKSYHSLKQFINKQRWAVINALNNESYGVALRERYFNREMIIRKYVFPVYALSFILPAIRAFYYYIISQERSWLYDPILSWILGFIIIYEFIKIKILKINNKNER